jgi:Mg/Co/Ni transporter MgtE
VDVNCRLLGTIGVDDVIDVIREEATEDIQRLGGDVFGFFSFLGLATLLIRFLL